jgi:synaptobrevin homolog YKT6
VLRTCVAKTNPGDYQRLEHEGEFKCLCFSVKILILFFTGNYIYIICRHNGVAGVCIADTEYPQRVAFSVITKLLDDFTEACKGKFSEESADNCMPFPPLEQALQKYQDPAEADKITKIQKDLEETKQVLYNTIDAVLARGEKLDDLIEKSDSLSMQSKKFYKTAKKHNQCCVVA